MPPNEGISINVAPRNQGKGKERGPPEASDEYKIVKGRVSQTVGTNSKPRSRTISARLYPNLPMYAMSRDLAEQLGLDLTAVDSNSLRTSRVVGSLEPELHHIVGHVVFGWHMPASFLWPLALGQPYIHQVK
ncbi:hypothetical protein VC83_02234 [Pseudogymnoascus destructans]|uniref:Uncharacterized protein n=1 Tax=Pseudogymnoascus destructans TaxID=655981 RepID=A0A177AHJ2_9PEZI|nr:uncharacterized protein VC83_02234 [Pseudogymnoascus destructans]OAF61569.1 hypothetical protein VC83_02234 [Pseudogymnoascus destructans]